VSEVLEEGYGWVYKFRSHLPIDELLLQLLDMVTMGASDIDRGGL
jgi:hypothetical protein